uniref:Uncharacterized protein n=1 Tax=viral metagenome TaxID=1070528 RepID=A0A6C0IT44_9ZZZZ
MYNLAFYTCFYGGNNNKAFKIPEIPSLKYKCYYFTNNKIILNRLQNTKWIGIFDNKQIMENNDNDNDNAIVSCMASKHVKVCPQEYNELKQYDYLCYLDSKLKKVNENFLEKYIHKFFIENNFALLLRRHWFVEPNIWSEYNQSMKQPRYQKQSRQYTKYINKQIKNGLLEKTYYHCCTGLLIRNMKHPKMIDINNTWYQHIQECGIQCQISFFFVKQLFKGYIYPFTEIPFTK